MWLVLRGADLVRWPTEPYRTSYVKGPDVADPPLDVDEPERAG